MFKYRRNKEKYETIGKAYFNDKCIAIYGTFNELLDNEIIYGERRDGWTVLFADIITDDVDLPVLTDRDSCKNYIESFYYNV